MGLLDRWAKKQTEEQLAGESKSETTVAEQQKTETPKHKKAVSAKKASTAKEKTTKAASSNIVQVKGSMYRVLIAPVVSEKATRYEQQGVCTFLVDKMATKRHVAMAVKEVYGVQPVSVAVINVEGKNVRFGRSMGRRSDFKKAFVKLPKGATIALHEGV